MNQCSVASLSVCFLSDKIKDLLKPGTVSTMTRLALVNAIYFKGNWMNRFDEANTKEMPFKLNKVTQQSSFSSQFLSPHSEVYKWFPLLMDFQGSFFLISIVIMKYLML